MVNTTVSQNLNTEPNSSCDPNKTLLAEFGKLWAEADELWEHHLHAPAFRGYVSADYQVIYEMLNRLRGRVLTFLEWGSGLGIATIMASRMGFKAYGIEAEPDLVEFSERFAKVYGPQARFAQGSFVPEEFEWNPEDGNELCQTSIDIPSAYDELDMELRDFDLVYAYPWPDEYILFQNILRQFGNRDALFLSYDAREGTQLVPIRSH